jgi:hypothetical protein
MNLPVKPFPNEFVLGWRGRLKLLKHYPNTRVLEIDLQKKFLDAFKNNGNLTSSDIPKIYYFAYAAGMKIEEFVQSHSLVPFFRAFDETNFGGKEWTKLALSFLKIYGVSSPKKGAWFCIDCLHEDISEKGIAYWRRGHQLPGVDWCLKHKTRLTGLLSNTAFNKPPTMKESEVLLLKDNHSLNSVNAIIQRYVEIAEYILNCRNYKDFSLVTHILDSKLTEVGLISSDEGYWHLNQKIGKYLSANWLNSFSRKRGNLKLHSIFQKGSNQKATELYLLLFSFIFESVSDVLNVFKKIEHMTSLLPLENRSSLGDFIYTEYIRNKGIVTNLPKECDMNNTQIEQYLSLNGLPSLCKVSDLSIEALRNFFDGQSLEEVCNKCGVDTATIENLLRISGSRFAFALNKMSH